MNNDKKTTMIGISIILLAILGVVSFHLMPDSKEAIVQVLALLIPGLTGLIGYYSNKHD
jgi:VIT1/CCC1 family predicted Fe2+/Mn2+ transporter